MKEKIKLFRMERERSYNILYIKDIMTDYQHCHMVAAAYICCLGTASCSMINHLEALA